MLNRLGFWSPVVQGALLGVALALMLPLSGITRGHEPFSGLLLVPALAIIGVIVCQYLTSAGWSIPLLGLLFSDDWMVIASESAFAAYTLAAFLRTRR